MLEDSVQYTDGKVLGYDEVIKVGYTNGKIIANILVNVDGISFGIDFVTELGSCGGYFFGSNYGKL